MEMSDQEHYAYMEHCERLTTMLNRSIDLLMHHIFEGRCKDPQEWEALFKAVNQAVFMK